MLIAISGTPGTGKSAVAKILSRMLKARLITTSFLVRKYKIKTSFDKIRKTKIVDAKKLSAAAEKEAKNQDVIFESHLAHLVPSDLVVALRTNPAVLEKRLKNKRWDSKKIRENVEAEAIGVISSEAKNALEIDTTGKGPKQTAILIIKILNNYSLRKKYRKKLDWSRQYEKYLKSI